MIQSSQPAPMSRYKQMGETVERHERPRSSAPPRWPESNPAYRHRQAHAKYIELGPIQSKLAEITTHGWDRGPAQSARMVQVKRQNVIRAISAPFQMIPGDPQKLASQAPA